MKWNDTNYTRQQQRINAMLAQRRWHKWFAWKWVPIVMNDGKHKVAWMVTIERRRARTFIVDEWLYREVKEL